LASVQDTSISLAVLEARACRLLYKAVSMAVDYIPPVLLWGQMWRDRVLIDHSKGRRVLFQQIPVFVRHFVIERHQDRRL
jgi:hypothetical protein